MPETLGNDLPKIDSRYFVTLDDKTGTWRILDTHNPAIKSIKDFELNGLDSEVPDDNPAITIIPQMAFAVLVAKATKIGALTPSVLGFDQNKYQELEDEIVILKKELQEKQKEPVKVIPLGSEEFQLKSKIIDTLRALAISENIKL
jgi:hypothetical protein